ncbi:MAG: ribosome maturation factor RimM [Hyphomicrobiaceae bacterium]
MSEKRILLGEITGAHGIRGEVLVRSYTGDPEAIADYGALTDEKGAAPLTLKVLRMTPKGAIIARVRGVSDRNGAEALKGRKLYVARNAMPEPDDEDDFYYEDLIGLAVVDAQAKLVGEVVAVQNYGAGDLLEIRLVATGKTELVSFSKASVPQIDLEARRITVVMPEVVEGQANEHPAREPT